MPKSVSIESLNCAVDYVHNKAKRKKMTAYVDSVSHRRTLTEFIKLYRQHPCLWMVKCEEYRDRNSKDLAYERLVHKMREIDPTADREKVVKKINSLRTNWRKERRKVDMSSAARPYKPRLWYYRLFEFLKDEDPNNISVKCDDYDPIEKQEEDVNYDSLDYEELPIDEPSPIAIVDPKTTSPKLSHSNAGKSMKRVHSSDENNKQTSPFRSVAIQKKRKTPLDDRHDIFGRNVASKLRDIADKTQRLLAEKLINDALFMAELGKLSTAHGVTSFNTRSQSPMEEAEYISGPMIQYEEPSQDAVEVVESVDKETAPNS